MILSQALSFISQFIEQLIYISNNYTSFSFGGSFDSLHSKSGGDVKHVEVREVDLFNALLLGGKDALDVSESRSVQSKVAGEDGGERHMNLLKSEINFTSNFSTFHVRFEFNLRTESSGRNSHNRSENLSSLDVVVIDGLLA